MIKINLLPQEKPKSLRVYYQIIGASALFIITVVSIGVIWYAQGSELKRKELEKRQKEKTVRELQVIIDQVLQYERDSQLLRAKLDTIKTLQNNQQGPVLLLEEVSKSLPEQGWLSLLQNNRDKVILRGHAYNMTSISDFMTALDNSPIFHDVKLTATTLRRVGDRELYEFELIFRTTLMG
jgi:type IV pilus assembly protein PilN